MKFKQNNDCKQDRYGRTPHTYITGADATPQKIYDALWRSGLGGAGYKFAIVIDASRDEYEEPPKETELYFLDELLEEVVEYVGADNVRRWIDERYGKES